jgi:hypothetical protein
MVKVRFPYAQNEMLERIARHFWTFAIVHAESRESLCRETMSVDVEDAAWRAGESARKRLGMEQLDAG